MNIPRQDSREAACRARWRVFAVWMGVCLVVFALAPLAGCTLNVAPAATDGSLLTVRGGNITIPAAQVVGTNGVPAAAGTAPKSATEWIIYVLIAVATAIYPLVIRPVRRWIESLTKNGNGAAPP